MFDLAVVVRIAHGHLVARCNAAACKAVVGDTAYGGLGYAGGGNSGVAVRAKGNGVGFVG